MLNRRGCRQSLGLLIAAPAWGQNTGRVSHIAHLSGSGTPASKPFLDALRDGMRAQPLKQFSQAPA